MFSKCFDSSSILSDIHAIFLVGTSDALQTVKCDVLTFSPIFLGITPIRIVNISPT